MMTGIETTIKTLAELKRRLNEIENHGIFPDYEWILIQLDMEALKVSRCTKFAHLYASLVEFTNYLERLACEADEVGEAVGVKSFWSYPYVDKY
ncbi:hypothetical protein [Methylophaga nitratireducenticrescens]|uniref:hypothetical protein n=1 Tax=Methylophaga nitratireducenticrescens TaxID=754476 RepID=UPI000CDC1F42|nr:hypothetical protein [Methylophaga nitratireducenticrescens]AUZ85139.1 hypothetical protein CDW43_11420 [Methylophaga nitratireducenticrescens]